MMTKWGISLEEEIVDGTGKNNGQSNPAKRHCLSYSSGVSDQNGDDMYNLTGKCGFCSLEASPSYSCVLCQRFFHESCDSFRIDSGVEGLCGSCLASMILKCPCCLQSGFKGVHGLRTHIGGYCKQHCKDWRQQFREFFIQLERLLNSIPNRLITAYSIIKNHIYASKLVATSYGGADEICYEEGAAVPDNYTMPDTRLKDYIALIQCNEPGKVRKTRSRTSENRIIVTETPRIVAAPLVIMRPETPLSQSDETSPSYNLRHKNSTQALLSSFSSRVSTLSPVTTTPSYSAPDSMASSPMSITPTSSTHFTSPLMPETMVFPPALPEVTVMQPEKTGPQNIVMDCPFCKKSDYRGLSGIRTHIRNNCPSIDKSIWREKYVKCVEYNIQKLEDSLTKNPSANSEFYSRVIADLRKAVSDWKSSGIKAELNGRNVGKDASSAVGQMNAINYETVYCQYCHDENDYCQMCGCRTCHYNHLASLLLVCDGCDRVRHVYCVSPAMNSISDDKWFCPECQERHQREPRYSHTKLIKDRNKTLSDCRFSPSTQSAIDTIQSVLRFSKSPDTDEIDSVLKSLCIGDLLQVQTYMFACTNRINNRIHLH